ncbi:unnamed protein product [Pleuronectes platessa]|uniref:Uncharacterized protein n=1 Tax=Pleuronectes platessa TaxID=8262 RepID=A0A9N7VJ82_PLEPL|nr:unnamed protein product [Pleuronectes platessa]
MCPPPRAYIRFGCVCVLQTPPTNRLVGSSGVSRRHQTKGVMFRRRVPFPQMALAMLLGVAGGLYIYRPFFEPMLKKSMEEQQLWLCCTARFPFTHPALFVITSEDVKSTSPGPRAAAAAAATPRGR